jgi:hypothetical protein
MKEWAIKAKAPVRLSQVNAYLAAFATDTLLDSTVLTAFHVPNHDP